jgi:hypothetical protein
MSAFSDWNGPSVSGGASLPQIQTLERLITDIGALSTRVQSILNMLNTHIGDTDATVHGVTRTINCNVGPKITGVENLIGTDFTLSNTVRMQLNAAIERIEDLESILQGYSAASDVKNAIEAINGKLGGSFSASSTVFAALNSLDSAISTKMSQAQVNAAVLALHDSLVDTDDKLKLALKTVQDIETGRISLRELLDFKRWYVKSAPLRPIANRQYGNVAAIIGYLSKDYFIDQVSTPVQGNKHKSATAFVKYANTKPWNATIQMSATPDTEALNGFTGSIAVVSAKTASREVYGAQDLPPLRFGLFKGTATSGADTRIYLGVVAEETHGITYDTSSWNHNAGPIEIFVAGINLAPVDDGSMPNGGVEEICKADVYADSSFAVEYLTTSGFATDSIEAADGTNILTKTTDIDGNKYIALGDITAQLSLFAEGRPSIEHADLSRHDLAYLSDLANSLYWQRTVAVVAADVPELNGLLVTVNDDYPDIPITWEDIPVPGHSNVPGIYTSAPAAPVPKGHVFVDGEVALVKDSGTTQKVVDGKLNAVLVSGDHYNIAQLTNIDRDEIKSGTVPAPTADGTTFIDSNGAYGYVTAYNPGTGDFVGIEITAANLFPYTCPAYATFSTTWTLGAVIQVPVTFDNYIHDVSYEWAGPHKQLAGFFAEAYVIWTVHHQNHTSMNYTLDAWSYIDIAMEGYRTEGEQDDIDNALLSIGVLQTDYTDTQGVVHVQLPGRALPTIVPNPAYIHHKPWTGVALITAGTFIEPLYYHDWMVDGGDFTGMVGAINPSTTPYIPSDKQFRNAIIRTWHGQYADTPELNKLAADPVWQNFQFTARWYDDLNHLGFSNGNALFNFVPMEAYPRREIITAYEWMTLTGTQLDVIIRSFDFTSDDPTAWTARNQTNSLVSDTATIDSVDYPTFSLAPYQGKLQLSSPRLTKDELNITALRADVAALASSTGSEAGDIADLKTRMANVESSITNLQARVDALEARVPVFSAMSAHGIFPLSVFHEDDQVQYRWDIWS